MPLTFLKADGANFLGVIRTTRLSFLSLTIKIPADGTYGLRTMVPLRGRTSSIGDCGARSTEVRVTRRSPSEDQHGALSDPVVLRTELTGWRQPQPLKEWNRNVSVA